MAMSFTFDALGDKAVVISIFEDEQEASSSLTAHVLNAIRSMRLDCVTDVIAAFSQIAVHYDPLSCTAAENPYQTIVELLKDGLNDTKFFPETRDAKLVNIPVCYEAELGIDIAIVAETLNLTRSEIIDLHQSVVYSVGAIGFAPGFGYLEGLDSRLEISRRETPRERIPGGSVAIGGAYTGIYPKDSPGGWYVLGRTQTQVFSAKNEQGSLFKVGDQVRFIPISFDQYRCRS